MNAFAGASYATDSESGSEDDDFLHPSTDPNTDEFADHNPRKRRRTGRDAKESAALGIFGSESEDEGPGKRWKNKKNIRGTGMSFVGAGQKVQDDEEDEEDEDEEDPHYRLGIEQEDKDIEMDDEGDLERPQLGVGLGTRSSGNLGFSPATFRSPSTRNLGNGFDPAQSPLGKGFVPSSEAVPILRDDLNNEPSTPRAAMPSAFSTPNSFKQGARGASAPKTSGINAGSFAARMMAKMGYKEGQGLGKDGQGRSGVIEVQLRPQGAGVGAVREKSQQEKLEERRQATLRGEVLEDSDEEKKRRKKERVFKARVSGTDSGTSTPRRRPKLKYQSLPEIHRAAPGLKIPDAFTPILDMTGPGQKFLTSASGLLTPTAVTSLSESSELVEAKKLARRAQSDLSAFVEEWKNLEERKAWVDMEILQQQQLIDEQQSVSDQMSSVATYVQDISECVKGGQWDPVIKALMQVEELDVADRDELSSIAVASIQPFLRQAIEGWQPLDDPKLSGVASDGFAPALLNIRHLLGMSPRKLTGKSLAVRDSTTENGAHINRVRKTIAFESLMYTVWFPKIRSAVTNQWDVYDPTPVQTLLTIWDGLLPAFIRSEIVEQLIVRKLDEAVNEWNPRKRRHAPLPHLWLFPWLQYLPSHHADPRSSTGLVSDVKRKFRHLIDAWDFKRGVIPGLQQWRTVLQPKGGSDQWTPLIINHVLPNLARYLRTNFKVAPQDQEPYMACLNNTLAWQDIIGTRMTSQLIFDEVFPMWMDVLHTWLTLEGVNYEEIAGWVDFWRSIIPESLSNTPAIQAEWQRGTDLINTALDLGQSARTDLPAPSRPIRFARHEPVSMLMQEPKPLEAAKTALDTEEVTFRHTVEDFCMANDIQLIPQKNVLDAHGPVYRVTASALGKGGVLIYFNAESVHAQLKRGSWTSLGGGQDAMDSLYGLVHQ